MRTIALVILLCLTAAVAGAQTTEHCNSIQRAGDILRCYEGTAPAVTLAKPKRPKPLHAAEKPAGAPVAGDVTGAFDAPVGQKAPYVDVLAIENSKLDSKMKTICRGC
jgi:hypothetical protein